MEWPEKVSHIHFPYLCPQVQKLASIWQLDSYTGVYVHRWYFRNHLQRYGGTPKSALMAYFLASANIFEPGRAAERLAWARTAVLTGAVTSHFLHIGYVWALLALTLWNLALNDALNAECLCTDCSVPKDSTENLEELTDLVSFDDVSGSLREAVKFTNHYTWI